MASQSMISNLSRRAILGAAAALPFSFRALADGRSIPIGLELYSVRDDLKKDLKGTLDAVGKMGYQCVEFYAPYYQWPSDQAREVRKQLDDLGVKCYSTHNDRHSFSPEGIGKAIELNQILGTRYIVLAHPGNVAGLDGWRQIAGLLNAGDEKMATAGLHAGYHNHDLEWKPVEGQKPIELLAAHTGQSVMLQLDVGTCVETGNDPVAWIEKNPGRVRSLHLKDWSSANGYRVLFGDGSAPWKRIFQAAEANGVEYYLIEQEGSDLSEEKTAEVCLGNFRKIHG